MKRSTGVKVFAVPSFVDSEEHRVADDADEDDIAGILDTMNH